LFYASYRLSFYIINSRNPLFMENVEVKQEIKNSDDGKGILITNDAIEQISNLLKGQSDKKALRVGVRSGGCSGMSYTMDFIGTDEINPDDKVYDYSLKVDQSFQVVCDPKSLLYIYGMQLDFSKDLIGGGFNFVNPNASQTCGCGSSFAV
jgi:iron-sulfur cluster assembly protein